MHSTGALVEMRGIRRAFGSVEALRGVDFDVGRGEIVGLLGDNGAGKSTLVNVLSGVYPTSSGTFSFAERPVSFSRFGVSAARRMGIETVHQDRALGPQQPLWRNVFMGRHLKTRWGLSDIAAVLFGLWAFFAWSAPQTFLSRYIYVSFMSTIPFVALGMTLVVTAGEMDLSFASNMAMSGFVFSVVTRASASPLLGLVATLAAGGFIGLLNGLTIVLTGIPSIVATIGFDFFWRGCVMLLSGGLAVALPFVRPLPLTALLVGRVGG